MKSAYELAMERLEKQSPAVKVTDAQRQALAEIDATYNAKIAEREVFLSSLIAKATAAREAMEVESLRVQLSSEVRRLQEECETKKAKERQKTEARCRRFPTRFTTRSSASRRSWWGPSSARF